MQCCGILCDATELQVCVDDDSAIITPNVGSAPRKPTE